MQVGLAVGADHYRRKLEPLNILGTIFSAPMPHTFYIFATIVPCSQWIEPNTLGYWRANLQQSPQVVGVGHLAGRHDLRSRVELAVLDAGGLDIADSATRVMVAEVRDGTGALKRTKQGLLTDHLALSVLKWTAREPL